MNKKNIIGLAITILLVILGIASVGISLSIVTSAFSTIVKFIVYVIIICYILYDYASPHSNLFKYIILLFGLSLSTSVNSLLVITESTDSESIGAEIPVYLCLFAMVFIGYMAGRLNKIKKNISIMIIVTFLLVAYGITTIIGIETDESVTLIITRAFSDVLAWLALCSAYINGYKRHIEAGELADKESA